MNKGSHVKNVDVRQAIGTIITCLICAIVALIPFTFGQLGIRSFFDVMPMFGDGTYIEQSNLIASSFCQFFNLTENLSEVAKLLEFAPTLYFGILALDVVMAILLIIFRLPIFRIIFKIISILAGAAMLAIAFSFIIYLVGFAVSLIPSGQEQINIMSLLDSSGFLVALGFIIFAFSLVGKQFHWFEKLY